MTIMAVKQQTLISGGGSSCPMFLYWNFEMFMSFFRGRKTGGPGEKPSKKRSKLNEKLSPNVTPGPGMEPGPQQWKA